jgi:hypothetical protein
MPSANSAALQEAIKLAERLVKDLSNHSDCPSDWKDEPCRQREVYELARALLSLHAAEQDAREKEWGIRTKGEGSCRGPFVDRKEAEKWALMYPKAYDLVFRYAAGEWQDAMCNKGAA